MQAELEREGLASQISRLRELLQKQQRLLDLTAGQIQEQHQESKKQAPRPLGCQSSHGCRQGHKREVRRLST